MDLLQAGVMLIMRMIQACGYDTVRPSSLARYLQNALRPLYLIAACAAAITGCSGSSRVSDYGRLVLVHDGRFALLSDNHEDEGQEAHQCHEPNEGDLEFMVSDFESFATWQATSHAVEDFRATLRVEMQGRQLLLLVLPIEPRDDRAVSDIVQTAIEEDALVWVIHEDAIPPPWSEPSDIDFRRTSTGGPRWYLQ